MFGKIIDQTREHPSLVHCITNYVTMHDCANMVLACGSSPIMANAKEEVEEVTSICNSLVINIGTLNTGTIDSMILAGQKANELGHPVVLDPVGAGVSAWRRKTVTQLLQEVRFSVIKGNISEIKTVFAGSGAAMGVDAQAADAVSEENLNETIELARKLSIQTGSVIVITGAIDLVVSAARTYIIENGHPMMARITGSGCMLAVLMGAYVGSCQNQIQEAAAAAVIAEGICGEKAAKRVREEKCGTGSFGIYLIDEMSRLTGQEAEARKKVRIKER